MTKLKDKNIWITGASSGIGEELTYQLAAKGNNLIISARRKEELERVASNCPEQSRKNIKILPFDLADLDALEAVGKEALHLFDGIDVLINNGGISQRSLVSKTAFHVDQRIMNVNFLSAVKLTKLVLPGLIEKNNGHIVYTSSLVGKFGTPFRSSYAASKHAAHGFFESLAAEVWEENVHVTLFCGGYIKTNVSRNAMTADGSPMNKMDENMAKGKPASAAALAMIEAVEHNRREVYFAGKELMGVYLKRFLPSLLFKIVKKLKIKQVD